MAGRLLRLMLCLLALVLVMPSGLQAANVGHFVQVEGQVDLLKGGKLPVTTAKVQEAVDQGDVVRTKKNSRAQIQFVDETVLTIGPSSRVAIEDYVFDAAKGKRSATIEIFRGLVHTLVKKIYQVEEPDFVVKTHTSVLGVRGTDWYTQLMPTSTDVYTQEVGEVTKLEEKPNPKAGLEAKNIFPEIKGKVLLKAMQFTRVGMDLPPTLPVNITKEDLKYLQTWINIQSGGSSPSTQTPESSATSSQSAPTGGLSTIPASTTTTGAGLLSPTYLPRTTNLDSPTQYLASGLYVPPQPAPVTTAPLEPISPPPTPPTPPTPPQPVTYNFSQSWFGSFVFQSDYPYTQGATQGWGWGQRTGVLDGYYSASFSHLRYVPPGGSFANSYWLPGTATGTMIGSVTGIPGETLTGNMTFTGQLATGGTFNYTGDVTLEPSGVLTYNYSGTRATAEGSNAGTTENGVMVQNPGTYFKQTVESGAYRTISYAPYVSNATKSDGQLSGTREGYSPGDFRASLSIRTSADQLNIYPATTTGTANITMEGVLSGSANDTQSGAMTFSFQDPASDINQVAGGPVKAYPDSTMVAEIYSSTNLGDSNYGKSQGMWVQTSDPQDTTFAQRMSGSLDAVQSNPPYNTGTLSGNLWGFRDVVAEGYQAGTISGTATGPDTFFEPPNDPSNFSLNMVGVVKQPGVEEPYSGVVFANGRQGFNNTLFSSTPGTVTIQPDGTAVLNVNNTYRLFSENNVITGSATSTVTTTPGIFFNQVVGPGSVTYTSNDSTDFTLQNIQLTEGLPITNGIGTLGSFQVTNFTGTADVIHEATNVFPANVISPNTMIYSQGVIGPGGNGAMQLTVVDAANWYRVAGAAVQTSGANLQGINLARESPYGPNRVPVTRIIQYQQEAVTPEAMIIGPIQAAQ